MTKVLVYGTLKRGYGNHRLLETSSYLGAFRAQGFELHSLGAFPAVSFTKDNSRFVEGELYEVDDDTLQNLDWLEGHPNFYERHITPVKDDRGHTEDAYIYVLDDYANSKSDVHERFIGAEEIQYWDTRGG